MLFNSYEFIFLQAIAKRRMAVCLSRRCAGEIGNESRNDPGVISRFCPERRRV